MSLKGIHVFEVFEGDVQYVRKSSGLLVPDRSPVEVFAHENMIVDTGKAAYLDRLAGLGSVAAFTSLGVGTDSTAAATSQIKLNPSVAGSVLIQAPDSGFPSRSSLVLTIKSTFGTAVANFNWNEAGYFNGIVNGTSTMFNRVVIGPFNKTSAVSIAYTTTITQS